MLLWKSNSGRICADKVPEERLGEDEDNPVADGGGWDGGSAAAKGKGPLPLENLSVKYGSGCRWLFIIYAKQSN